MTRLPLPPQAAPSALFRARAAWGDALPAWVARLATECDAASQSIVAKRLGYSAARISQVINNKRMGDPGELERAVRGAFMGATVACPGQGTEIPQDTCVSWSRRPYDGSNHVNVRMFQACRACPQRKPEGA